MASARWLRPLGRHAAPGDGAARGLYLMEGGPFDALCRSAGLVRDQARDVLRLSLAGLAVTWLPLVLLSLLDWALRGTYDGLLQNLTVEARSFVVLPLLFFAAHWLNLEAERTTRRFVAERLAGDDTPRAIELYARTARAGGSTGVELLLAGIALAMGVTLAMGWSPANGVAASSLEALVKSPARTWYCLVSLPLSLFLIYRVLWRWLLWCHLLWGLARLRLRLDAAHPDGRAGLKPLSNPSVAFAPAMTALAALAAAQWGQHFLETGVALAPLKPFAAIFAVAGAILSMGPLLFFSMPMLHARSAALREYGGLASEYVAAFRGKWLGARVTGEPLLGTADVQSMADLGNVFKTVESTRIMPATVRRLLVIVAATVAPLLPLALTQVPVGTVALRILKMALGGD